HTKHCSSCSVALQRLQKVRKFALILSIVFWSLLPLSMVVYGPIPLPVGVLLAAIPLAAGILSLWLGDLEQKFYQGDATPPRNLPD
ncbi:MAG: cell death suppressor protein Lls1, partial [Cyanobacteria bacterium J06598_1]